MLAASTGSSDACAAGLATKAARRLVQMSFVGATVVEVVDVELVLVLEVELVVVVDAGIAGTVQPKVANSGSREDRAPALAR